MTIKPGSIWLFKSHSIWKSFWYFLRRKELPYNSWIMIDDDTQVLTKNVKNAVDFIIAEPKKNYSKKEIAKLQQFNLSKEDYTDKDLFVIINVIRPNTLNPNGKLDQLLCSKFYNIRYMSDEKEYTEYIYNSK